MDYYIEANGKTNCKDDFPSGLSFFFEQVGGFEEKSMVMQVEKILKINLSIFQDYDFEGEENSSKHWKNIKTFEKTIDDLLLKIKANPDYYKKVKYNSANPPSYGYSTDKKEMERMKKQQREYEKSPLFGYPADNGYLSSKKFVEELNQLKSILNCYKKHGATKIKLSYY
ncbi:hypothetical protein [Flavobacterium tyrosinilyticum]|uniref:hypothetical protein n=1 Tax=Flavobacterium tyrosinilyticum TaxID=1658740 RepID=UPI00202E9913|nr:hypothetical protein [Flavobacterium tyrosinilyticum]MCM0664514.1 hypothetical protein [Flavobacterium tyrosinilyticum]